MNKALFPYLFLAVLLPVRIAWSADFSAPIKLERSEDLAQVLQQRDFFVTRTSQFLMPDRQSFSSSGRGERTSEDCRARIASLMCLTDSAPEAPHRTCIAGGEKYATYFEQLYDTYPLALKKVFCSLDVIYVENRNDGGTAYAGTSVEDGTTILGIRKSLLDRHLELKTWATWKEQLSFGGRMDSYDFPSPQLPRVLTANTNPDRDFLYFVIAHEFGHILDFANLFNQTTEICTQPSGKDEEPECQMKKTGWGAISWQSNKTPKATQDFPHRAELCFYFCNGKFIAQELAPQIYSALYERTAFISIYATTEPWDDFADSVGYYSLFKKFGAGYEIEMSDGSHFNIMEKLKSPRFAEKYKFLDDVLNRSDLKYPQPKIIHEAQ